MVEAQPGLQDALERLTDMPALPNVVARLTRLIADPKTTASDINDALSADPGLVARILRLVNSPFYGFSRRIATVTNAVVILGFSQVRSLALSAFIFDKLAKKRDARFDLDGLWRHSLGTAFAAAGIARHIDPKLEEDAFICGLLHDLGKFVMARNVPEHLALVLDAVRNRGILFNEAEHQCLDYDHAQLGAAVMERWNLPGTLVRAVLRHHTPLPQKGTAEEPAILDCIASLADILARILLMGNGGDARVPLLTDGVWKRLGLDWAGLENVARKAAEEYAKSDAFFQQGSAAK